MYDHTFRNQNSPAASLHAFISTPGPIVFDVNGHGEISKKVIPVG